MDVTYGILRLRYDHPRNVNIYSKLSLAEVRRPFMKIDEVDWGLIQGRASEQNFISFQKQRDNNSRIKTVPSQKTACMLNWLSYRAFGDIRDRALLRQENSHLIRNRLPTYRAGIDCLCACATGHCVFAR